MEPISAIVWYLSWPLFITVSYLAIKFVVKKKGL